MIKKIQDINSIKADWQRLLREDQESTPFQSWPWLEAYLRYYQEGATLVLGDFEKERLVGLGVFEKNAGTVTLAGGERTDYKDILSLDRKKTWEAFLDFFLKNGVKNFSFDHLREFSSSPKILQEAAKKMGFSCQLTEIGMSPFLNLKPTWEEYLVSLPHNERKEIKRKIKKLEVFQTKNFCFKEDFHQPMKDFYDLYRQSSSEKIMDQKKENFYLRVAQNMAPTGWPQLCFLYLDRRPIASYFSFVFRKRLYLYNAGLSHEYRSLSPGTVLLAYMIREEIKSGRKVFDFLQGDERYKYDFGARDQKLFKVEIKMVLLT